jgi:glycine/D-amino acid oxidase-like deaminating enzyme
VRVHEGTSATALEDAGDGVVVRAGGGAVRARRAILATSAFPPLLRAIRRYVLPVYDARPHGPVLRSCDPTFPPRR